MLIDFSINFLVIHLLHVLDERFDRVDGLHRQRALEQLFELVTGLVVELCFGVQEPQGMDQRLLRYNLCAPHKYSLVLLLHQTPAVLRNINGCNRTIMRPQIHNLRCSPTKDGKCVEFGKCLLRMRPRIPNDSLKKYKILSLSHNPLKPLEPSDLSHIQCYRPKFNPLCMLFFFTLVWIRLGSVWPLLIALYGPQP